MEEVLVVSVCLVLNALFSAFEMAFVAAPKPELRRLARSGNVEAKRILVLRDNPERALSIIQIGITLVGVISAAVGGAGAAEVIEPYFKEQLGLSEVTAEALAIVVIVVPLTYLSVVVGELVPKTLALRNAVKISLLGGRWLSLADRVLGPAVTALEWSTKNLVSIFFSKGKTTTSPPQTTVEIDSLSQQHAEAVLNLAHIEGRKIKDILVSWSEVNKVSPQDPVSDVTTVVFSSGHTRLPVFDEGKVIGILHTKEFLAFKENGGQDWLSIIRPAIKIQSMDSALGTLRVMQEKRSHMAVVYSGNEVSGIVTLEDILEEIVGDIFDEDDESQIRKIFASRVKNRPLSSK